MLEEPSKISLITGQAVGVFDDNCVKFFSLRCSHQVSQAIAIKHRGRGLRFIGVGADDLVVFALRTLPADYKLVINRALFFACRLKIGRKVRRSSVVSLALSSGFKPAFCCCNK
jgi:hypothetical protein